MPGCAVAGCLSYYRKTKGSDIKYFSFPKNEDLARLWENACQRKDKFSLKYGRVCSLHFAPTSYEIPLRQQLLNYRNKNSRNLKPDAVPTENLPLGRNILTTNKGRRADWAKKRSRRKEVAELLRLPAADLNRVFNIMEEVHFIKCETEWTSDTEGSSKFEEDVQLPCVNPLDIKVEPNLKSEDQEDDEKISYSINEEFIIQDVKKEPSDDLDDGISPNGNQSLLYPDNTQVKKENSCKSSSECSNNKKKHNDLLSTRNKHKKPFPCNQCKKVFRDKHDLTRHTLIHTGEKQFVCNFCSKAFRLKGGLKNHLLIHTSSKANLCPTCGKAFRMKHALKTHLQREQGEKSHRCPSCDKVFINACVLKPHIMLHVGEEPYPCSVCGEVFYNVYVLKLHMFVHSKEEKICV